MNNLTEEECLKDFEKQMNDLEKAIKEEINEEAYREEIKELATMFVEVVKAQEEKLEKYYKIELEALKNVDTSGWPEKERKAKEQYETLVKICQILKKEAEEITKELN